MRRHAPPIVLAIVVSACSGASSGPVPTSESLTIPSSTTAPSTSTTIEAAQTTSTVDSVGSHPIRDCESSVPVTWTLLCQAYDLVSEHHVAEPSPVDLAAAAVLGVESTDFADVKVTSALGPCVLPVPEFEPLCAPILDGAAAGKGTVEERVEAAVQGLFRYGLDPFSSYIEPDLADRLDDLSGGIIPTLGVAVAARLPGGETCGPITNQCRLRVTAVFPFGMADRSGVVVGDVISHIDGIALLDRSPDEAVALLFGPPGTTVDVSIVRDGSVFEKTLVHEDLRVDPVEYELLDSNIALLRLNEFSQLSAQLIGLALDADEVRSSRGLILDMRANPGGLLLAAQAIASQFLSGGVVLVEEARDDAFEWPVIEGGLAPRLPLVVLTSRDSASAAEVVAAALQEARRATIVGDRTFGKNAVQFVFRARNGGEFRVTTSYWQTAGGTDVGVFGLQPDILIEERATPDSDPVLERAIRLLGG